MLLTCLDERIENCQVAYSFNTSEEHLLVRCRTTGRIAYSAIVLSIFHDSSFKWSNNRLAAQLSRSTSATHNLGFIKVKLFISNSIIVNVNIDLNLSFHYFRLQYDDKY